MAPFTNIHLHSNILQPLYRNSLPKIKLNRHFPSTMAASSPIIRGLGLPSLEVEQAVEMISLVMSLFPASVATSFYLRESLELLQLESGIDSPRLGADFDKLSFLTTPCWMHHLWSITSSAGLQLCFPTIHHPQSKLSNESTIIFKALSLCIFSRDDIHHLNVLRIHLQVIFMSNILQEKTNYIKHCFRVGKRDENKLTKYKWPVVVPSKRSVVIWDRFLRSISAQNNLLSPIIWRPPPETFQENDSPRWFNNGVTFEQKRMSYATLFRGEATFVVDGSFFPNRSDLISAAWFLVSPSFQKLAIGDFITTVAMDFRHPFASEICGALSIFFFIDEMFQSAPINTRPYSIEIQLGSDC